MNPYLQSLLQLAGVTMSEKITFHREGYFKSGGSTPTQCTKEGWAAYKYQITVEADYHLDQSGFLIDHNEVHECIVQWAKINTTKSCEVCLKDICLVVSELLLEYGVKLRKVTVKLKPANMFALMVDPESGHLTPMNGYKSDADMPANAEYEVKFNKSIRFSRFKKQLHGRN